MKNKFILLGCVIALLMTACNKTPLDILFNNEKTAKDGFVHFNILPGKHFSDKNGYVPVKTARLSFRVVFDSSAIYQTANPDNQYDINKLFGFSDNNAHHHQNSARFGWRWSDGALRLFAYVYNDGERSWKELGTIQIGAENECSISVDGSRYIFSLNGKDTAVPRTSVTEEAEGYKLYPYFGGEEPAPHELLIKIKETPGTQK